MIDFGQNTITNRQAVLDLINSVDTSVNGLSTFVDIQGSFSAQGTLITTDGNPVVLNPIAIKPDFFTGTVYAYVKDFNSGRCSYAEYGIAGALSGNTYSTSAVIGAASLTNDWYSQFDAAPLIEIVDGTEYPTIQISAPLQENPYPTLNWFVITKINYPS